METTAAPQKERKAKVLDEVALVEEGKGPDGRRQWTEVPLPSSKRKAKRATATIQGAIKAAVSDGAEELYANRKLRVVRLAPLFRVTVKRVADVQMSLFDEEDGK